MLYSKFVQEFFIYLRMFPNLYKSTATTTVHHGVTCYPQEGFYNLVVSGRDLIS